MTINKLIMLTISDAISTGLLPYISRVLTINIEPKANPNRSAVPKNETTVPSSQYKSYKVMRLSKLYRSLIFTTNSVKPSHASSVVHVA